MGDRAVRPTHAYPRAPVAVDRCPSCFADQPWQSSGNVPHANVCRRVGYRVMAGASVSNKSAVAGTHTLDTSLPGPHIRKDPRMSHIVSIATQIRDPVALASACRRLGLQRPEQRREGCNLAGRRTRQPVAARPTSNPGATRPAPPHPSPWPRPAEDRTRRRKGANLPRTRSAAQNRRAGGQARAYAIAIDRNRLASIDRQGGVRWSFRSWIP